MNREVKYVCDDCKDRSSALNQDSKNFCRVSSFESSFVCAECSKFFGMAYEVSDQKASDNNLQEEFQVNCSIQSDRTDRGESSGTLQEIDSSTAKASEDKRFKCHLCDLTFDYRLDLVAHKTVHKSTFKCMVCNQACRDKYDLSIHMQKHSNVKPYKCSDCSKRFKYYKTLKVHMNAHKKLNPFRCKVCEKNCTSEADLRRHIQKHSDKHPYKCSMCHKVYKYKASLRVHMGKHKPQGVLHPAKKTK